LIRFSIGKEKGKGHRTLRKPALVCARTTRWRKLAAGRGNRLPSMAGDERKINARRAF
jgi:hypothetical protein